jgi:hypothetical protein
VVIIAVVSLVFLIEVPILERRIVNRTVLALTFVALLVSAVTAQQQIPTGGPIPDRRGFNNSVNDPKLTDPVEEVVRRVAGNVYVIAGAGGNIAAQAGPDGLFLVDDNFAVFYPRIVAALRQISDKPVRMIVNTHSHFDHNQNNANFAKQGALIFAHPNLRMALMQQTSPPVPPEGLPVVTSNEPMTFHFQWRRDLLHSAETLAHEWRRGCVLPRIGCVCFWRCFHDRLPLDRRRTGRHY